MKRQTIISILLSLFILLAASAAYYFLSSKKKSTISDGTPTKELREVEVLTFPPSEVKSKLQLDGRVQAFEKINLAAEVQGKLLSTGGTTKEGSYFNEGDLLFKIESTDDEYSVKALRSQLYTAITQIMPDLKFDYPEAFERWKQYLDSFDVERSVKALPQMTVEKYFIGGKNIQNLYYSIKSQEERLKNYNVFAPFSGIFLTVNNYPGSLVSPGQALAQIMNTSRFELISPIPEKQVASIRSGQTVNLVSETGTSYTGKVNRIGKQIDPSTQNIPVYISISGKGLRDGMYVKGSLTGSTNKDVSIIPDESLVNQNELFVYRDSLLSKITVEVLSISNGEAIVKGLTGDEQIVTSSTNNLYSGQKVKISK